MDVSPAKRSYFTCANVWWKLLFHSTQPFLFVYIDLCVIYYNTIRTSGQDFVSYQTFTKTLDHCWRLRVPFADLQLF